MLTPKPAKTGLSLDPTIRPMHAEIMSIAFQGTDLVEVWLLDTGRFLILRDVPEAYRSGHGWVRRMRQRRVLRMYLPQSELARLPAIETTFEVAKRGFEIRDAIERTRLRAVEAPADIDLERLKTTASADEIGTISNEIRDTIERWRKRAGDALAALRGIAQHTDQFPAEDASGVRTIPYEPPLPFWRTDEERAKLKLPPRP